MTLNITNAGLNAVLRALAGDEIIFTKVQIGNGDPQDPATVQNLSNPLLDLQIKTITAGNSNATLQTKFNNSAIEAGFRHTETGIWIQDQDDATKNILYAYGYQEDAKADYIAPSSDSILETELDLLVFVGEASNVSAAINESLMYATKASFDAHTSDTDNPHVVTKQQVGLGNVPNVSTNDQVPTYTESTTLEALTSGEKLSIAFGKIKKAIATLISHLDDQNNPHKIKPETISAAEKEHRHSTTDITSGVLGVARGGTGTSSLSQLLASLLNKQNLDLDAGRSLRGRDSLGNLHNLAGIKDNVAWFGTEPGGKLDGETTHFHSAGGLCLRTYDPDTNTTRSMDADVTGNWYPYGTDGVQAFGRSSNRWATIYCVSTNTSSDTKAKQVLGDIDIAKALISGLHPVAFRWKQDARNAYQMGFLAQEVYQLMQSLNVENAGVYQAGRAQNNGDADHAQAVCQENLTDTQINQTPDADLSWGLDYTQLIAPMVAVIQDQQEQINTLKAKVDRLEGS